MGAGISGYGFDLTGLAGAQGQKADKDYVIKLGYYNCDHMTAALVGALSILLNTIAGVQSISKDYFHAARTMGAGSWSLFKDVMVPAALPDILTGMRLAVSAGWMSVI